MSTPTTAKSIKRLYVVSICIDHVVWSSSAAEASEYALSLPVEFNDPRDWYATTKLSRTEPDPSSTYSPSDLESQVAYDVAGLHSYIPVLITDDADIDLDLTVERAIELDRLNHTLSLDP
jgi:hypothetical protein